MISIQDGTAGSTDRLSLNLTLSRARTFANLHPPKIVHTKSLAPLF